MYATPKQVQDVLDLIMIAVSAAREGNPMLAIPTIRTADRRTLEVALAGAAWIIADAIAEQDMTQFALDIAARLGA